MSLFPIVNDQVSTTTEAPAAGDGVYQGLPVSSAGAVRVAEGTAAYVHNGIGFTSAGQVALSGGVPIAVEALGLRWSAGGGGGPQLVTKSGYTPDFSAATDGTTTLRSVTGWTALSSTGATTTERDQWKVTNKAGGIVGPTASADFGARPGKFVIARDAGSANHVFKTTISTLGNGEHTLVVAATNETNCVYVSFNVGSGAAGAVTVNKRDSTGAIQLGNYTFAAIPELNRTGTLTVIQSDEIAIHVIGQRVHVFVNGRRLTARAGLNLDTTRSFTKGQYCGFGTFDNGTTARYSGIYMASLDTALQMASTLTSTPGTNGQPKFYAGAPGVGRSISLSGTWTGTQPTGLQYRVVNESTNAVIQDWQTVSSTIDGGGTWSCSPLVPMSDNTTNPRCRVEFRCHNDTDARTMLALPISVGLAYAIYGQSNAMTIRGAGATAYTVAGYGYQWETANATWIGGTASAAAVGNALQMAEVLSAEKGIPVGIHVYGVSGAGIGVLNVTGGGVGSSPWLDDFVAEQQNAKVNTFGYFQPEIGWVQGENEANGSTITDSGVGYRAGIDTLLANMAATGMFLGGASPKLHVAIIGAYLDAQANGDVNWPLMRQILFGLSDKANVSISHSLFDMTHVDGFHYTQNAYKESARRFALSFLKTMGEIAYDGRGPIVTGATRSGATITLAVNLNGASSISGTDLTNYQVAAAADTSFSSPLTISAGGVDVSGNTIQIVLSSDPGGPVMVRSFHSQTMGFSGMNPPSAIAQGSYADGTTIPVEPIYTPITST